MEDRGFNEVDLRRMLQQASSYRPDVVEARWVVETRHAGRRWEAVVRAGFRDETPRRGHGVSGLGELT
jgi:hypothetical protein